jgi:hypothetical protein
VGDGKVGDGSARSRPKALRNNRDLQNNTNYGTGAPAWRPRSDGEGAQEARRSSRGDRPCQRPRLRLWTQGNGSGALDDPKGPASSQPNRPVAAQADRASPPRAARGEGRNGNGELATA